jgi:hypothetical protein
MKEADLPNYKRTLEEFLKRYIEYTDYVSHYGPSSQSAEIRTWLQRKTNLVDLIINRVHYEPEYTMNDQTFTFYSLLGATLKEGADEDELWKDIKAHVIRIINEGVGNIENNTVILKEIEPVLVIRDQTLRKRCLDLLKAPGNFDRVINQATQVLEARLRDSMSYEKLCEAIPEAKEHIGEPLANKLLAPKEPVIVISEKQIERAAFHKMVVGIIAYLRNPSHHLLDDKTEWALAWAVVGIIDALLSQLENSYIAGDSKDNKGKGK